MSSKSKSDTYKKGDKVRARWSGSNVFYDAKIIDSTAKSYKVQYEDGSISSVKLTDVKKPLKSGKESSPKSSKSKSRSRSRSVGRPRSRSRSPARREKKAPPAKKEEKKTPPKVVKKSSEASPNSNSFPKDETDSLKTSLTRERIGSSKNEPGVSSSVTTNSLSKMTVSVERYEENTGRLRSSRIAALQSSESAESSKFDSKTIMQEKRNALPTSETKYSDDESDDIEIIEPSAFRKRGLQFMYFLITLLRIIVMPTVLLFLIFACTKKQCTVLEVPQFFSRWKDFGNIMKIPFASVIVFHTFQCLLSLIPLGKKVTGFPDTNKSTLEYHLNGLLCLICTVVVFSVCSYLGLYMNWGYDKYKTIALSSAIYCLLCSLVLHIASLVKGNGTVTSKVPLLGKFYNGSYTNPLLFGKVDVKTSFIRVGLIGSVVLNLSILLKFFLMRGYLTVPLVMTAGMQIFFVFDLFIREEKMLSTATYTSDSIGYAFMMTSGFLIPMGLALQNIFLFNNDAKAALVPHYCSALIACFFFGGYYIYLTSGNLKHNFRRNPFSPSLSDVASIPTSKKKRLIASGWWGKVRHPNYLGLLIMAIAWTLPCGISHFVPYGPLIMLFIALVIRIFRVEAECKDKYGPAWSNYTEKVSSRLIPYIF